MVLIYVNGGTNNMKYKVIGIVYSEGEKRKICYADDFDNYTIANNYAEYLDNSDNWQNNNLPEQPFIIYVEEY